MPSYVDTGADITRNKNRGSKASADAFQSSLFTHKPDRERIVKLLDENRFGMTSKELSAVIQKPLHVISARCAELKKDGVIIEAGSRRDGAEVLILNNAQPSLALDGAA